MIEVRLHSSLYGSSAVEEAVRSLASHAQIELVREDEYWVVRVSSEGADERSLGRELANFALGLTAEQRGAA